MVKEKKVAGATLQSPCSCATGNVRAKGALNLTISEGQMIVWWLLGGVAAVAAGGLLYKKWKFRRPPSTASHCVMTKTTDGELLQFLVRPTRRTGKELR